MKEDKNSIKEKEYKPAYNLKKEDFIPIIGFNKYTKRYVKESSLLQLTSEGYLSQCLAREVLLAVYNLSLATGVIAGISGLVKMLSK